MDMESKIHEVEEMSCSLICKLKAEFDKGLDCVNTAEAGEVTDMIKDLAETKRNLCEAMYYESVIEAMNGVDEERYGYNPNRYASGRYAPTGYGRKGYRMRPYLDPEPYIDNYLKNPNEIRDNIRMGYDAGGRGDMHMQDSYRRMDNWDDRYGKAYNEYKNSRRYYTETKSPTDKHEMETHATEHIMDTVATVKEIYKSSDPELRKKIKEDITKLVGEMTV